MAFVVGGVSVIRSQAARLARRAGGEEQRARAGGTLVGGGPETRGTRRVALCQASP